METEEGYNRACQYNDTITMPEFRQYSHFLGEEIELQPASEPTDIIWENRNYTENERLFKKVIVAFIILILLSISFTIIFISQKASLAKKNKYPKVQCSSFEKDYQGRHNQWSIDSINEYQVNLEYEKNLLPTHFEGTMQCFCNNEHKHGVKKDFVYEKTKDKEVIFSEPICKQYSDDLLWSKILGQSIAFIIIAVNLILKAVIIQLCFWIGEDTESEQKAIITNGVFYAQFFNTGFLILLVNANLQE